MGDRKVAHKSYKKGLLKKPNFPTSYFGKDMKYLLFPGRENSMDLESNTRLKECLEFDYRSHIVINAQEQFKLITTHDIYYSNNNLYNQCYVSLGTNLLNNEVWE